MTDIGHAAVDRQPEKTEKSKARKAWWKPIAILAFAIVMLFVARYFGLGEKLKNMSGFIQELGPWGPVAFILIYIGATVAAVPGSVFTVLAGALFGSIWGSILVNIAATVGACICFLIARYFARDAVDEWVQRNRTFRKLDRLTSEHGWMIVAVTRLVPIFPYNLLNYGFGLTNISFGAYLFWTWLCMIPATVAYVVGGEAVWRALVDGQISWTLISILIALGLLIYLIVRLTKSRWKKQLPIDDSATEDPKHA